MKLEEVLKNLEVAFGKEAIKNLEFEYGITPGTEPELAEQPVFTLTKSVSIAEPSPSGYCRSPPFSIRSLQLADFIHPNKGVQRNRLKKTENGRSEDDATRIK